MRSWIENLLADPAMLQMGHGQRAEDANLGLGWIYYGLVRSLRAQRAVVIGSWRGFVPLIIGKAMQDNLEGGNVVFIDPSLVDDFWKDADQVERHFKRFGVTTIRHYLLTTQQFVTTPAFHALTDIELLFIDGLHTFEQSCFDYTAFTDKLAANAVVLFHDSIRVRASRIYGDDKIYEHRVRDFINTLRSDPALELFALPLGDGITLLRRRGPA